MLNEFVPPRVLQDLTLQPSLCLCVHFSTIRRTYSSTCPVQAELIFTQYGLWKAITESTDDKRIVVQPEKLELLRKQALACKTPVHADRRTKIPQKYVAVGDFFLFLILF